MLQGTLDMFILRTPLYGPAQRHQIDQRLVDGARLALPGAAPAGAEGWIVSTWETVPDRNRAFKYYRLTDRGRKQPVVEESHPKQMAEAVASVMPPTAEEG